MTIHEIVYITDLPRFLKINSKTTDKFDKFSENVNLI